MAFGEEIMRFVKGDALFSFFFRYSLAIFEKEFDRFLSLSVSSREIWKIIRLVRGDVLLSQVIFFF